LFVFPNYVCRLRGWLEVERGAFEFLLVFESISAVSMTAYLHCPLISFLSFESNKGRDGNSEVFLLIFK